MSVQGLGLIYRIGTQGGLSPDGVKLFRASLNGVVHIPCGVFQLGLRFVAEGREGVGKGQGGGGCE